jgi:hypothetical protein
MPPRRKKTLLDLTLDDAVKGQPGKGKNFHKIVDAGAWVIAGFSYRMSKCTCCERKIVRVLKLKNLSHGSEKAKDAAYGEYIDVGLQCGPKVFNESCAGFYEDPAREWERQFQVWKQYITYVILCAKSQDIWNMVPSDLRERVDGFLEGKWKEKHDGLNTGPWWRIRDAKRKVISIDRDGNNVPRFFQFNSRLTTLVAAAQKMQIIDADYVVGETLEWKPIDRKEISPHSEQAAAA